MNRFDSQEITHDELRDMLSYISPEDRETWNTVIWAVSRHFHQDASALAIIKEWGARYSKRTAKDEKHEELEWNKAGQHGGSKVTIGSVIMLAKQHGYMPPKRLKSKDTNEYNLIVNTVVPNIVNADKELSKIEKAQSRVSQLSFEIISSVLYYTSGDEKKIFFVKYHNYEKYFSDVEMQLFKALKQYMSVYSVFSFEDFLIYAENFNLLHETIFKYAHCKTLDHDLTFKEIEDKVKDLKTEYQTYCKLVYSQKLFDLAEDPKDEKLFMGYLNRIKNLFIDEKPYEELESRDLTSSNSYIQAVKQALADIRNNDIKELYVPTGFSAIDSKIQGFAKGDMNILGANTGVGKTYIGIQMQLNAYEKGFKTLFLSAEMAKKHMVLRTFGLTENLSNYDLLNNKSIDEEQIDFDKRIEEYNQRDGYLNLIYQPRMSIQDVESHVRRYVYKGGVDFVVIDYLQLLENQDKNKNAPEYQNILDISKRLTVLAKETNTCILVLTQLKKPEYVKIGKKGNNQQGASAERANLAPSMHDVAGASGTTLDAGVVMLLYKEDVKNSIYKIKIEKSRHGNAGDEGIPLERLNGGGFKYITPFELAQKTMQIDELEKAPLMKSYNSNQDYKKYQM